MAGARDIAVVHAEGADLDAILAELAGWTTDAFPDANTLSVMGSSRMVVTTRVHLSTARAALGPARAVLVLGPVGEAEAALNEGADEFVPWPVGKAWLRRRVAMFLDGRLGPSRIILDPRRATSLVHAVRNPLNVITLYAELLKMEVSGEDALGSVGRLVRAAKRVDALVGELETLLYLESGDAAVQLQPLELGELVQIVLAELSFDIEDKPLTVHTTLAAEGTLVRADPDLTRRALQAILGRVTKLCLSHAEVEILTTSRPPSVVIRAPIEPIPAEHVGAFTHPATELDARESLGGVGVGLSFAQRAVSAMSGQLEHGTTDDGRAETRLMLLPA